MANIQDLKAKLQQKLGKDFAVKTGDEVDYIDESNDALWIDGPDWWKPITSVRGIPVGFLVELFGRPDSGKTSTAMYFLIEAQKKGWIAILVDAEQKFSYDRFNLMGGDSASLLIVSENTIEENFDKLEKQERAIREIDATTPILIVYDSIAVGASQAELEKEATDPATMADQAKVIKRMVRRQVALLKQCKAAFIAVNQCYSRIGSPGQQASGGQGLEFAKALSIQFTKRMKLEKQSGGLPIKWGIEAKVQCEKNHLQKGDSIVKELPIYITATKNYRAPEKSKKGSKVKLADVDGETEVDTVEEAEE
jgi:recombination protein RecA